MSEHLLPPSATQTERDISLTCAARCAPITPMARALWDPQTCPASLLPWLAWTFSVDRWRATWPESTKRAVVAAAMGVHRRKGTVAAVRQAVEALGTVLSVREWFEYGGDPYTARIEAYTDDVADDGTGLTPEVLADLLAIIEYTAPVRVHFDLEAGARFSRPLDAPAILPRPLAIASQHWRADTSDQVATITASPIPAAILARPINISSIHLRGTL